MKHNAVSLGPGTSFFQSCPHPALGHSTGSCRKTVASPQEGAPSCGALGKLAIEVYPGSANHLPTLRSSMVNNKLGRQHETKKTRCSRLYVCTVKKTAFFRTSNSQKKTMNTFIQDCWQESIVGSPHLRTSSFQRQHRAIIIKISP